MKRSIAVLVVLIVGATLFGDTPGSSGILPLDRLGPDLSTLFGGIGDEILVNMNQMSLAGQSIGDAELGAFPHLYVRILGLGVTAFNGIGGVLRDPDTVWQFEALPMSDLIETNVGGIEGISDIYQATKYVFALPSLSGGIGFGITHGFEVLTSGYYLSDALVFGITDAVGLALPPAIDPLKFTLAKVHVDVRKTLISEAKFRPALAASIGFDYTALSLGYELSGLGVFLDKPIEILGSELDLAGNFDVAGSSTGLGIDLQLSKSLLYFLTPFLKVSTWYHSSSYNVDSTLTASQKQPGADVTLREEDLLVSAAKSAQDVSVYLTGGMEIKLLVLVLQTSVGVNLQGFSFVLGDAFAGDFTGTDLNKVNFNLGIRIQI